MEPDLGAPVELHDRRRQRAVACAQVGTHVGAIARVGSVLAEHVADEAVARLGKERERTRPSDLLFSSTVAGIPFSSQRRTKRLSARSGNATRQGPAVVACCG